jgi:hypothetical protein
MTIEIPFVVFADALYGSEQLADWLEQRGIKFVISASKPNDLFKSIDFLSISSSQIYLDFLNKGLSKGQDRWLTKGNILGLSYYDNAIFNLLTNVATPKRILDTESREMPHAVWLYRQHYGHIDQLDSSIQRHIFPHRTEKYSTRYLQGLFHIGTVVAWRFHQFLSGNKDYPLRMFMEGTVKDLLGESYSEIISKIHPPQTPAAPSGFCGLVPSNKKRRCALHAEVQQSNKKVEWICTGCKDEDGEPLFFHIHCHYWYHVPRDKWPEDLEEKDFKYVHQV